MSAAGQLSPPAMSESLIRLARIKQIADAGYVEAAATFVDCLLHGAVPEPGMIQSLALQPAVSVSLALLPLMPLDKDEIAFFAAATLANAIEAIAAITRQQLV